MKENIATIEELEYFNPFDSFNSFDNTTIGFSFLYSPVYPCYLDYLRQIFLAMACYDGKEKPFLLTSSAIQSGKESNNQSPMHLQILKRGLDNLNNAGIKITRPKQYAKEDIKRLNKNIRQVKTNIKQYINIIKQEKYNVILLDYLDNINERLENADKYRNKVPYIYYLQELMQTFRIFNDANNKENTIFNDWNKTFELKNDVQIINFQGCLGLLMMNEFCYYCRKNDIKYIILCAMLMTNLCIYSPLHREIEKERHKELIEWRKKDQDLRKTNATNAHKKAYKGETVTERDDVFNEAKNLMSGENKDKYYKPNGKINMAKLVDAIISKRIADKKRHKCDKTYKNWLTNEEYIKIYGDWHN